MNEKLIYKMNSQPISTALHKNECSEKRVCPLIAETLINNGISGFSNHRMIHYKCIFRKTVPPLKAQTTINTGVSKLSNHRALKRCH